MDWLARQNRQRPDAPALFADEAVMTYGELAATAARGAARLDALGIGLNQTLLWEARASLPGVCGLHAALSVGASVVPFRPGLDRSALGQLAARTDAGGLLATGAEASGPSGLRGVTFAELTAAGPERRPVVLDPERVATLMQTSGSGGRPKLVPLRWRHHAASVEAISRRLELSAADRWLVCLPLHHIGGLAILLRAAFTGAGVVLHERFDAARVAAAIDHGAITHLSLVPTQLRRLLAVPEGPPRGRLRCVLIGGAFAAPDMMARARAIGLPVVPTWGMTESASQLATPSPAEANAIDYAARPGRVGRPLDGVEVRLAGVSGREDELEVRAPQLFEGYADGAGGPDAHGWFATGDRGAIDAEGRVRIIGRVDDRIISGGENVDPRAVEAALIAAGLVDEAVVIGLPDAEWGERVAAVVVGRASVDQLAGWAQAHLEPHQRPRHWRIVACMPRTDSGKPDRAALVKLLQGDQSGDTIE